MSAEGLSYTIAGFQEGSRANTEVSYAAQEVGGYLRRVQANAGSWGGDAATEFINAVNTTRDVQARGVAEAAEGRDNMAVADAQTGLAGEELEKTTTDTASAAAAATQSLAARSVAEGMA